MKNLPLHNIDFIDTLAWPTTELFITAKTSALSILTDFTQHRPLVIRSNVKAVELEKLMKQSHVKMKLVIDDNDKFVGLVTLYDLSEENHLQHCLIIDTQLNMIRGVISARDIARLITPNVDAAKHFSFENLYNEHKTKLTV
jgi:CBS-domain-containing membrane protein